MKNSFKNNKMLLFSINESNVQLCINLINSLCLEKNDNITKRIMIETSNTY